MARIDGMASFFRPAPSGVTEGGDPVEPKEPDESQAFQPPQLGRLAPRGKDTFDLRPPRAEQLDPGFSIKPPPGAPSGEQLDPGFTVERTPNAPPPRTLDPDFATERPPADIHDLE